MEIIIITTIIEIIIITKIKITKLPLIKIKLLLITRKTTLTDFLPLKLKDVWLNVRMS